MIYVVRLGSADRSGRMDEVLAPALSHKTYKFISSPEAFFSVLRERLLAKAGDPLAGYDRYLFAVSLPESGYSPEWYEIIAFLMGQKTIMERCCAAVIVDGAGALQDPQDGAQ